ALDGVLAGGARWAVEKGYGVREDLGRIESDGCLPRAAPASGSRYARARGQRQRGSLGSGNHFLEVQTVEIVYDPRAAETLGLHEGAVTVMIHTGSRGLGHQGCTHHRA